MEGRAAVASENALLLAATTERGPPDHSKSREPPDHSKPREPPDHSKPRKPPDHSKSRKLRITQIAGAYDRELSVVSLRIAAENRKQHTPQRAFTTGAIPSQAAGTATPPPTLLLLAAATGARMSAAQRYPKTGTADFARPRAACWWEVGCRRRASARRNWGGWLQPAANGQLRRFACGGPSVIALPLMSVFWCVPGDCNTL